MFIKRLINKTKIKAFVVAAVVPLLITAPVLQVYAIEEQDYILSRNYERIPIAKTYVADKAFMYFGEELGPLNSAQDIFIDAEDNIYIADTGNNRIIRFDKEFNYNLVVTEAGGMDFKSPSGLFVDGEGDIYVADTDNFRIVHLSRDGEFIEEFTKPTSELYDQSYPFRPIKLAIDGVGQIYVLNREDYHGFVIIDAKNEFKGYVASTKVEKSIITKIQEFFYTAEQKEKVAKILPAAHSNFVLDELGTAYTTTLRTFSSQLSRFSPAGNNIFPRGGFFGEYEGDYSMIKFGKIVFEPQFVDVTVNKAGIVTIIDKTSGRLYQYDSDGMLLTIFGGTGKYVGRFTDASSLAQDSEGNMYVIDALANLCVRFKPTAFIKKVHYALELYHNGEYEKSIEPWKEIVDIDSRYMVAHLGLAKAYLKQEKSEEAMAEYQKARSPGGYAIAFELYRKQMLQKHFGIILLCAALIITGIYFSFKYAKKAADKRTGLSHKQIGGDGNG